MSDWIDVTRTLTNGMIHWPGDSPFQRRQTSEITGTGTPNLSEITTSLHIGTHIDAPLHFLNDGIDIAEVPLSKLCGPAVVVDIQAARDITAQDVKNAGIKPGERVLFRTPNQALWDKQEFDEDYYAISGEAARCLVEADVPAVGIDYLSVDKYHNPDKPAHYILLGNGVVLIEALDLAHVEPGRYEMVALPLKIACGDGSPARVILRPLNTDPY